MKKIILITLLLALLFLPSCAKTAEKTFFAFDTLIGFKIYGQIPDGAEEYVKALEKVFSKTDPESELYALNGKQSFSPSDTLYGLLTVSLELCKDTGGAFDITSGAVTALWDEAAENSKPPEREEIENALSACGCGKVKAENGVITKPEETKFDLGAVAKGYAAELMVNHLKGLGVTSGFMSFGGSIAVIGDKPDGSGYKIGVRKPDGEGTVGYMVIHKGIVSTSGDYERYFEYEGKRYHHIIDMKTGEPANGGVRSCTVVADDGAVSDALSTALFVDPSLLDSLYGKYDFEAVLITADNKVITTADAGFVITANGYSRSDG